MAVVLRIHISTLLNQILHDFNAAPSRRQVQHRLHIGKKSQMCLNLYTPEYPSLNLAMAVQLVAYEIYRQAADAPPPPSWDRPAASMAAVETLLAHFQQALADADFLDTDNHGQTMTRLRRLFSRVQLDETEVGMLPGILTHLAPREPPGG